MPLPLHTFVSEAFFSELLKYFSFVAQQVATKKAMAVVPASTASKRFSWMGMEHSETSMENLALLRADETTVRRYANRGDRFRVAREARCYLESIKRELFANDEDAAATGNPTSGLQRHQTEAEEEAEAALNLASLVRGARFRNGSCYTSGYDGTSHDSPSTLMNYNKFVHQRLGELLEKRRACEHCDNPKEQALCDESHQIVLVEPEAFLPNTDEDDLETNAESRKRFNARMLAKAKEFLKFALVRKEDFLSAFRGEVVHQHQEAHQH